MYPSVREKPPRLPARVVEASPTTRPRRAVGPNVVFLGLTSFFTDISSEMVTAVLPLYLTAYLRFTPLQFGVVEGLYQGTSALVRMAGGFLADRTRHYKGVALGGYVVSALCKAGLPLVGRAWTAFATLILADRIGKGMRTAPRDALIALSSPQTGLARAFGVHRALDTGGAVLGPVVAFGVLAVAPNRFDTVFTVSASAALIGVAVLACFVRNHEPLTVHPPLRPAGAMLSLARHRPFRRLVVAGVALAAVTVSDAFVYLVLQRRLALSVGFFPLLFVGSSAVYLLLAVPAGRLADRVGRARVFLTGHGLLIVLYLAILVPASGPSLVVAAMVALGAFYAATDGVLAALASATLPAEVRATGLSTLSTATALARLAAAVAFGAGWTWFGDLVAVSLFGSGLIAALIVAAFLLARMEVPVEAPR